MTTQTERTGLQLRTLAKKSGELELSLVRVPVKSPGPNEVVVRIDAAPINPSDLGLLFGPADMATAKASGTAAEPIVTAQIPEGARKGIAARLDQSLPAGNEGAGVVIEAGSSPAAQALAGKMVAILSGGTYGQYRTVDVSQCLELPPGATAAQGASSFVNPLTALGMVDTLRREGHKAIVHTAAASSLGQMLHRLCAADDVPLVNIVRKKEQEDILTSMGAKYVLNATSPTFAEDLTEAIAKTGATLAFDATGGGTLANRILTSMEAALSRNAKEYSRYGSTTHKQVYIYGGLDTNPTELRRTYGMAWGVDGWLVMPYLQKIGVAATEVLKRRVAAELTTTFATTYSREISLAEALSLEAISAYGKRATGEKYLVTPNKNAG